MMANTEVYPGIVIGAYRIVKVENPCLIWIGRTDRGFEGEGGVFNAQDFEQVIAKFYRENF
jgi:hypothetical protein